MHEYYFKIKKGDIEFECSTTDKLTFEQKLSDWINGLVQGKELPAPETKEEVNNNNTEEKPQRSGFIDVKSLASINEIQTPNFNIGDENNQTNTEQINFEDALNDSIQNPKTEVVEKKDITSEFEEFTKSYNPETQIDYLIITALYILNVENQERFTIKQLNSKLVPLNGKPVDHALIEEAINQDLLKIVPDLTGTSEYTEYTLTEHGEGYFVV